ncbi:acyl-CoA dehydrogenase family protein [Archaeoglobus veneficus]|uniref:Isovaleryl-CoA dehydrogenase n=1 Tax=Archaeoglobus veneficus (strain DSM 11195 / SNP6) TaxID=693661 RepID=F2KR95_ARCVS|nr:acyl-CoA dehydrogenase family protein [Archaeoglobus veneficus]AEA47829.1 Isovaleryl-CoA dehydrogenase [Archaeoglobus veneficus SNP6]
MSTLTPELVELAARKAAKMDEEDRMDAELIKTAFELGLMGVTVPEKYGGLGKSFKKLCMLIEELGKVNAGFAVSVAAHHMAANAINLNGSGGLKEKWLPQFCKKLAAFATTEPKAGSDLKSIELEARDEGDCYVLNGNKTLITNGELAEVFVVLARCDNGFSLFVVERGEGMKVRKLNAGGMRGSGLVSIRFNDVEVPKEDSIPNGLKAVMNTLNVSRPVFSAIGLGIAERCLDLAIKYAKERKAFGKRISEFQGIQWMLAEVAADIEALRLMVYSTAESCDPVRSAMCKLIAAKTAKKAADVAIEIFGGHGTLRGAAVERAYRDAKILDIGEGTSEIMKLIIARGLLKD